MELLPGRVHGVPYQGTVRTTRSREQVLDELERLDVGGARVSERGSTYLVFAPRRQTVWTIGRATATAAVVAVLALVLTAVNALWILLLPCALLAYAPLLIEDHSMLAVGAVEEEDAPEVTRLTLHGLVWEDLGTVLDSYLRRLPAAPEPEPEREPGGGDEPHGAGHDLSDPLARHPAAD